MRRLLLSAVPVALALAACAGSPPPPQESLIADVEFAAIPIEEATGVPEFANHARAIGMTLSAVNGDDNNTVSSPLSLMLALAMLAEGADGSALQQIEDALGTRGEERSRTAAAIITDLKASEQGFESFAPEGELPEKPLVHVANQLVLKTGFTVEDDFLERLQRYHNAGMVKTDLSDSNSKQTLDAWVKKHTAGLIEESHIIPNAQLVLVLQNAVLFAARWMSPFSADRVYDDTFTLLNGEKTTIPMMHDDIAVQIGQVGEWSAAHIPYVSDFAATVILPPRGTSPTAITEEQLNELALDAALAPLAPAEVVLPKLDVEASVDLMRDLRALGIDDIFEANTNPLVGINAEEPLAVGQAAQQAHLIVDEDGTVAAAVTEMGVEFTAAPSVDKMTFTVDRPFIFIIEDVETRIPLFYATIMNPAAK
ncbi:MAG: serpin family protein [Actinomycetaceae bacterium]|nr:serpin family protein [Actinomycetaceae bacterium]